MGIVMVVIWAIIWIDRFCFLSYLILSICAGCGAESIGPMGNVTSVLCSSLQSTMAFDPFVQKGPMINADGSEPSPNTCSSKSCKMRIAQMPTNSVPDTMPFGMAFFSFLLQFSFAPYWGANSSPGVISSQTPERLHVIRFWVY
jgi:hypothetical protein